MHPELLHLRLFGIERTFYSYGALMVLGMALAIAVARGRARRAGLDPADVQAVGLLAVCGGLAGAWALFQAVHWRALVEDPVAALRAPGMVFYGGFVGALGAALVYTRRFGLSLLAMGDAMAPALPLGHAVGRVGCFLAGCCYGRATSSVLGVRFVAPEAPATELCARVGAIHPVQLYEAAGLLVIALVLGVGPVSRAAAARGRGLLFALYIGAYAVLRLAMESLRGDGDARGWLVEGRLSTSEAVAGAMLGLAVALAIRALRDRSVMEGAQ